MMIALTENHLSRVFHNHIGVDSRRVVLGIGTENFGFRSLLTF